MNIQKNCKKVGIAGVGAIGNVVAQALINNHGIGGFSLECICDPNVHDDFGVDNVNFDTLVERSDLIIECLPAHIVPELAFKIFSANIDVIFISSAALLIYPEIMRAHKRSKSHAYIPSGALCGLDGVRAMKELGIKSAKILSIKPPMGFLCAPHIVKSGIDLTNITKKTRLFKGNALEASEGFPANINVAATLSLAGVGPIKTGVEIWADPDANGNSHEIIVRSDYSTLCAKIENMPDPQNPKSSILAAQSIIVTLRDMSSSIIIS